MWSLCSFMAVCIWSQMMLQTSWETLDLGLLHWCINKVVPWDTGEDRSLTMISSDESGWWMKSFSLGTRMSPALHAFGIVPFCSATFMNWWHVFRDGDCLVLLLLLIKVGLPQVLCQDVYWLFGAIFPFLYSFPCLALPLRCSALLNFVCFEAWRSALYIFPCL